MQNVQTGCVRTQIPQYDTNKHGNTWSPLPSPSLPPPALSQLQPSSLAQLRLTRSRILNFSLTTVRTSGARETISRNGIRWSSSRSAGSSNLTKKASGRGGLVIWACHMGLSCGGHPLCTTTICAQTEWQCRTVGGQTRSQSECRCRVGIQTLAACPKRHLRPRTRKHLCDGHSRVVNDHHLLQISAQHGQIFQIVSVHNVACIPKQSILYPLPVRVE